ncbi:MAG: hypothetical protein ACYTDX_03590, partial [Planctomycetota bacterium]
MVPVILSTAGILLLPWMATGCGGGGSGGGVDAPTRSSLLGGLTTVQKLETPLGLTGARGSGADVFVSYNLRDREYNPVDIQVEYGYDVDGDGVITGSEGEPSETDEYFLATDTPNAGDGLLGLSTATGKGADHLFVWQSVQDLTGARFVTQDFTWTSTGRAVIGSDGEPVFGNTPGLRMRMRANDNAGSDSRWGPWKVTKAFDLNNNNQPEVVIDATGLFGVTPNATGTAADETVVLNFHLIDLDQDDISVAVDYAAVPPGTDLGDP